MSLVPFTNLVVNDLKQEKEEKKKMNPNHIKTELSTNNLPIRLLSTYRAGQQH